MKTQSICIALLLATIFSTSSSAQQMQVATYNIRYANERDSGNLWKDRLPVIASLIRYHGFEVFGIQEGLHTQLLDLGTAMPEYGWYGLGRDDGRHEGEHAAIFFKKDRFQVLKSGDFWLSETPDKPGPGWDASLNRICTWLQLRELKSGSVFFIFNAHYDHRGVEARVQSSRLVLKKILEIAAEAPAIFIGDLNGGRESIWYRELSASGLLRDSHDLSNLTYQPNGSFNGFRTDAVGKDVIDHVFVTRHFLVSRWAVLTDTYHGKFPSDHFPVTVMLELY